MVYFKGYTIIGEYMKRNIFLVLSCLFCFGCATPTLVYKSDNYTTNTKTFSTMGETTFVQSKVQGEYDAYFPVANGHRLIYHHPGDYTADTYSYYIALKKIYTYEEISNLSASYNGKELPIAVVYSEGRDLLFRKKNNHYVNILLTKEDLIYAYENVGKLIIPLVADGTTYNIVFPDYYLRKVLASTTNIDKYKIAEQLANPPAPAPAPAPAPISAQNYTQEKQNQPITKPLRKPFEYNNNYKKQMDELATKYNLKLYKDFTTTEITRYSFIFESSTPCYLKLNITADSAKESYKNSSPLQYLYTISAKEDNVNEQSCDKIEVNGDYNNNKIDIKYSVNRNNNNLSNTETIYLNDIKENSYIRNLRKY